MNALGLAAIHGTNNLREVSKIRTVSRTMRNNKNVVKKQLNLIKKELNDFQRTINEYDDAIRIGQNGITMARNLLAQVPPPFIEGGNHPNQIRRRAELMGIIRRITAHIENLQARRTQERNQMQSFRRSFNTIKNKYKL